MRDSPCPRCLRLGKKRYYSNGDGNIYVRWEHWDGELQTRCHVGRKANIDYEVVDNLK